MLQAVHALARAAVMRRLTLLANHVLAAEPVAVQRLAQHPHKVLRLSITGAPAWWPFATQERFEVTPAGLVEWLDSAAIDAQDHLTVRVAFDRLHPTTALAWANGQGVDALQLQIDGDAQLAAEVDWIARECRWDVEADVALLAGPVVARQLATLGQGLASALRSFVAARAGDSRMPASAA
jgi:ubiquinone biosynthesis accessory factor UbiJ